MTHFTEIEKTFIENLKEDIDFSVHLGLEEHLDRLDDPGMEHFWDVHKKCSSLLAKIDIKNATDIHEKIDLQLIKSFLERCIFFQELEVNGELQRKQKPGGINGISGGIFQIFVNDERDPQVRLANILNRLRAAPQYLQKELSVLTTPITRWRDIEVTRAKGIPMLLDNVANWAKEVNFHDLLALEEATTSVKEAIAEYVCELEHRKTCDTFAIGEEKVKELLAIKAIDKTPEELRRIAENFMVETESTIEQLRQRLVKKYALSPETEPAELQEFLNKQYAVHIKDGDVSTILDVYKEEKEKILAFIIEKELFPVPEEQEIQIMQTPSFLEPVIPAGAMWPPFALRDGIKKSLVYLTLKEGELTEHTHLGIPVMMIHEGIPGHHLQFATASLHDSFIRRIFNALEHAEGWTTMLEDYMLDVGYIKDELVDEVRFISKREMSRLVARVGIDLYFMTGNKHYLNVGVDLTFDSDDPFENAGKLLQKVTGFSDGRTQAELNWYSTEQGYPLSYLTGNHLIWNLKGEIERLNKKGLSQQELDKEFHRIYLTSGCMPINTLRSLYEHEGLL